jgi:hypothetical protein
MWATRRISIRLTLFLALAMSGLLTFLQPVLASADDLCIVQPNPLSGLGCDLGQGVGSVVGGFAQSAADQAERALTKWVVDTAVWLLQQLANVVFNTSSPVLSVDWFRAHYADMIAVAWVVAPVFLLLGIVQAVLRADLGLLGRILAQFLVVAIMTTGAVAVAQLLIGTVDQLSSFVSRNSSADLHNFLTSFMTGPMIAATSAGPGQPVVPLAFAFLAGVLTILGAVLIWLELLARTLVIYAALLFFPVLLAAALWPRASGMVQILAEVLVAVIVSKFIIVVIVAAGVAALTATGSQNAGPSLLVGAGLLLVAAWAPWKFYRLMPTLEAAMVHQVGRPLHQGWQRAGVHGQRTARNAWRSNRTGSLPVAGKQRRTPTPTPSPVRSAGTAAAATATAGVAVATHAASRVRERVANVGGFTGDWLRQPVAGAGHLLVPDPGRVRNPRPSGARPAGGGTSGG